MQFTKEDIMKIKSLLSFYFPAVKDSELPLAEDLRGGESISLVQHGHSVRTTLGSLLDWFAFASNNGIINMTEDYRYNLPVSNIGEAILMVKPEHRKRGLVITFQASTAEDGSALEVAEWQIWQFKGELNQWNNVTKWEQINYDGEEKVHKTLSIIDNNGTHEYNGESEVTFTIPMESVSSVDKTAIVTKSVNAGTGDVNYDISIPKIKITSPMDTIAVSKTNDGFNVDTKKNTICSKDGSVSIEEKSNLWGGTEYNLSVDKNEDKNGLIAVYKAELIDGEWVLKNQFGNNIGQLTIVILKDKNQIALNISNSFDDGYYIIECSRATVDGDVDEVFTGMYKGVMKGGDDQFRLAFKNWKLWNPNEATQPANEYDDTDNLYDSMRVLVANDISVFNVWVYKI